MYTEAPCLLPAPRERKKHFWVYEEAPGFRSAPRHITYHSQGAGWMQPVASHDVAIMVHVSLDTGDDDGSVNGGGSGDDSGAGEGMPPQQSPHILKTTSDEEEDGYDLGGHADHAADSAGPPPPGSATAVLPAAAAAAAAAAVTAPAAVHAPTALAAPTVISTSSVAAAALTSAKQPEPAPTQTAAAHAIATAASKATQQSQHAATAANASGSGHDSGAGERVLPQQSPQVRSSTPTVRQSGDDFGCYTGYAPNNFATPPRGPKYTADGAEDALAAQPLEQQAQAPGANFEGHAEAGAGAAAPLLRSRQLLTHTPAALRLVAAQQVGIRKRRKSPGLLK